MKRKNLLFSIITPSFNQGHFIEQTIQSVLDQEYKEVEYIVMDGGSSDKTISILKKYAKQLRFESKKDKGQSDAINKGLKLVQGDILAYINSDDYYLPSAFETVARVFEEHPDVSWVVGDASIVDSQGNEIQSSIRAYKSFWRRFYFLPLLSVLNPIPQPSVFFRAQVFQEVGFFNENLSFTMDYDYWLRIQQSQGKPFFIQKPLSAFRIHGESKGGSAYEKQFKEELSVAKRYTDNPMLILFHTLHSWVTVSLYKIIKG